MVIFKSFREMLRNQNPEHTALIYEEGGEKKTLSYGKLLAKVEAYPERQEKTIGILCYNNLETILSIFALADTHNLVLLSPNDEDETLKKQMEATAVNALIGEEEDLENLSSSLTKEENDCERKMLFFTSGTTNTSKAVVLSMPSLLAAGYNGSSCLALKEDDILYSLLPYSHVFGFVCSLLWGMYTGASVALARGYIHLGDDLSYFHPTAASLVPQMAGFFFKRKLLNPELKTVLIGAGDCPGEVLQGYMQLGIRLSFGYGLTETSSGVALSLGDNPRAMTVCPLSKVTLAEDGEILIAGKAILMEGYYHDPEGTKKALEGGVLHTGDLGYFDSAKKLHLNGRKKETLVLSDGEKIFLPEYEAKLLEYYPKADLACNLIDGKIVLFILTKEEPYEVERKLALFNKSFHHSEKISHVVYLKEKLPRTQTGKVKRYLLTQEGVKKE